eukprot:7378004-Prymnesium_polylepis.2
MDDDRKMVVLPQIRWCEEMELSEQQQEVLQRQFWTALASGDVSLVLRAIDANVDVNAERDALKTTPLHISAAKGQTTVVEALIGAGASVTSRTWNGSTPLHVAAQSEHHLTPRRRIDSSPPRPCLRTPTSANAPGPARGGACCTDAPIS